MGVKKHVGGLIKVERENAGLNPVWRWKLLGLSAERKGNSSVAVKCVDIGRNTSGTRRLSGLCLTHEMRKPGRRTGLDTPVVLAVNDGY